jgi:DNA-binding transcriptional regulator YhcF (GntR family)
MTSTARHLYEELAEDLTGLIAKGTLRAGDRLPSVRVLSDQRSVSISTVLQAYLLLESRGFVETRPQSGHYVRSTRLALVPEPRPPRVSSTATKVTVSDLIARVYGASRDPNVVLLGGGYMSPALLPTERLNRGLAAVARAAGGAGIAYDPPPGLPALRRQIARRAAECGVALRADELVTTVGTMEALHLCLRAVARAGDTIVVESPAYYGVLQLIESLEMRALEIPSNAGTGIDLGLLDTALRQQRVKACLVVTSFSNPSGALMPDDAKRELVKMLARRDIPLIEDDIYGDLHFDGARDAVRLVLEDARARVPRGLRRAGALSGHGRAAQVRPDGGHSDAGPDGHRGLSRKRRLRATRPAAAASAVGASGARERVHRGALPSGHAHLPSARRVPALGRDAAGQERAGAARSSAGAGGKRRAGADLLGEATVHELHPGELRLPVVRGNRTRCPDARPDRRQPVDQRSSTMAYTSSRGCPSRS